MSNPLIAVPHGLREVFRRGPGRYKILFFSAGTGWGKTAVVNKLLEKQTAAYIPLGKRPLPRCFSRERLVVLDDFQELPPQGVERFRELLRKSPQGQRFILLSRGPVPAYLSPYEAADALLRLGSGHLALDTDCLARLSEARGLALSDWELQRVLEETGGCPAAVNILLPLLSGGQPLRREAFDAMAWKMGAYIDEAVLRLLEPEARRLLRELSLFDGFDQSLAETLAGDGGLRPTLDALWQTHGLIEPNGDVWRFRDQRFLVPYLQKRLLAEASPERVRAVRLAGGRWYADRRDLHGALRCCRQAGSRADALDLLAQNARLHPGACWELREEYDQLSEEEIGTSPDLLCAMSVLRSMAFAPEESERWYRALTEHIRRMDRRDGDYKRVRGLRYYLDIVLPHRGTAGLAETLLAAEKLLRAGALVLPEINVTGGLPSALRGGKDLSEWVPRDQELYRTLRAPAEKVLGRFGVGLGELALAESLLEKGEDISGRFLTLTALQEELRARGAPEMELVLTALLARALLSAGDIDRARELLNQFRSEAALRAAWLLPNIDAMLCRVSLLDGSAFASVWFTEQAPGEGAFYGPECHRCLTKARCYLQQRQYHAALLLLGRVLDCARRYARPLDMLETLILISVCRFRMGNEDWREHFAQAVELGGRYGYTAVFTREGAALLPLLEHWGRQAVDAGFWERVLSGTVEQAGYYGRYLQLPDSPARRLTRTETMVLRLICQNKTNEEICALLGMKLPTVKTHVRSLFKKLKVSSRADARKAAVQHA